MGNGVYIAAIHPGETKGCFTDSLARQLLLDAQDEHRNIVRDGGTILMETSPRIAQARCDVVQEFLNRCSQPDSPAEWLLFIDADMKWEPEYLYRILDEVAHPIDAPIVGGLCFGGGRSSDSIFPTLYALTDAKAHTFDRITEWPLESVVKVDATGAAWLLIHKSVFEAMAKPYPEGYGTLPSGASNPTPWFHDGTSPTGISYGEDLAFCLRARTLGFPIYVDTRAHIGHQKTHFLTTEGYIAKHPELLTQNKDDFLALDDEDDSGS